MPLLELQELPRLHRFSRVSLLVLYGLRVYAQCLVLGAVLPKMVCNTEVARSCAGSEPAAATGCMTRRVIYGFVSDHVYRGLSGPMLRAHPGLPY